MERNDWLRIENLTFTYPNQHRPALEQVSLCVRQGEFLVLCGPSGCGKSTLLRQLKPVLAPHGIRTGNVFFAQQDLYSLDVRQQSQRIGFVQQNPDNQIVTDRVWHELAFGLESLGYDTSTIRRRVAEMASFFGIQTWFHRPVAELSGGQKQLLNLASVMVTQPSILILDEPTSQLDPIAASDFLETIGKINRELGTTVFLTEQRLEETFPMASRVAVMEEGRILCTGTPNEVGTQLKETGNPMFCAMPAPMRIWAAVESVGSCPVTVGQGRDWLREYAQEHPLRKLADSPQMSHSGKIAIEARDLWFRYEKELPDVVRGLSLSVQQGEYLALLGGNGTGKTTTLKLLAGLRAPDRGAVDCKGHVGVLPQDPQSLFVKKTVREDLWEILNETADAAEEKETRIARAVTLCRLEGLLSRHPYDLSGGEQQRAALAKVLVQQPEILLLDEPTKGLDAEFKQVFAEILQELLRDHVTIVMVSHDIEFCARYAQRCALMFDGSIVAEAPPHAFFSGNSFYTTAANRMARDLLPEAVTAEDVILACGGTLPDQSIPEKSLSPLPKPEESTQDWKPPKLSRVRKTGAIISGAIALVLLVRFLGMTDLTTLIAADGMTTLAGNQLVLYGLFLAALLTFVLFVSRRSHPAERIATKGRLSRRTLLATGLVLLLIPITLFLGVFYLDVKQYTLTSLLILMEMMLPFFLVFESRKPQARELVVIAVLCAIGVAGRAAFFMLPQFKPVMALTILTGVAFGGETGFLVGAMTMLTSNVLFGQGPLTPWQMFAMGIIGFLAGILFRRGWLRCTRAVLCGFGALAAIVIYGGIMNPASALVWTHQLQWKIMVTYFISGFPFDCVQALATWLFLWFGAEPMLEKLDRMKQKYGLLE